MLGYITDPAAEGRKAPAGSAMGKTLASLGPPEEIYRWEADGEHFDSWFYWAKKHAYTFGSTGVLVTRSDWSVAALKPGK